MNASNALAVPSDNATATFAADLAEAVFPLALPFGVGDRWIDLELDLWRALSESVAKCAGASRGVAAFGGVAGCRNGLLTELADVAYRTTLRHGTRDLVLDAREGLHRAFRWAMGDKVSGFRRAQA